MLRVEPLLAGAAPQRTRVPALHRLGSAQVDIRERRPVWRAARSREIVEILLEADERLSRLQ